MILDTTAPENILLGVFLLLVPFLLSSFLLFGPIIGSLMDLPVVGWIFNVGVLAGVVVAYLSPVIGALYLFGGVFTVVFDEQLLYMTATEGVKSYPSLTPVTLVAPICSALYICYWRQFVFTFNSFFEEVSGQENPLIV